MEEQLSNTRVSIGMPIYNAERYLEETLDSVLNQSYQNFVLYISDNASTDRTQEICEAYASKDKRIKYIRNPENVGAAMNYERCYEPATTEYFRWQNADDPIEPELIQQCVTALDNNPDAVLAYGEANIIDENGNLIRKHLNKLDAAQDSPSERFKSALGRVGIQNQMYGLIRRNHLANTARMKGYVAADLNLVTELSLYGKFIRLPDVLFNRRMHPECSSWERADSERQKNFWDPSKRKLVLQTWRSILEHFKAISRSPISSADKRAAYMHVLKFSYWRKAKLFNEAKELVKYGIFRMS